MSKKAEPATTTAEAITIPPPNIRVLKVFIQGTAPFVQNRFSKKSIDQMKEKMKAGSTASKGKKRDPRDFDEDFKQAMHLSEEGWYGIPAPAFRAACIDACRMVGFKMTHAKMSVFIKADGLDALDGTPLVRLLSGDPEKLTARLPIEEPEVAEHPVRNATGVADIRIRPMWRNWGVNLTVEYNGDQFTATDVINLLRHAGGSVGVGEGRPYSKSSNGMGWGTFDVFDVDNDL